MKLYYATGTCSLAPHIVALEAGISLDLERVDISKSPRVTETGEDYLKINPNGYVPALVLDNGAILTESAAIAQYLADLRPGASLVPPPATFERARLQSWMNFIATELHKMFSPWLFNPASGDTAQGIARERIADRLAHADRHLAANGPFLLGDTFSAADAYLFTIAGWAGYVEIDLSGFPALRSYLATIAARPAVETAMRAEGLKTGG